MTIHSPAELIELITPLVTADTLMDIEAFLDDLEQGTYSEGFADGHSEGYTEGFTDCERGL